MNTDTCDVLAARHWIKELYKHASENPPKYFFFCQSPLECVISAFIVECLSEIEEYNDTEIYSNVQPWIDIFEKVYKSYSQQYDQCVWDDNLKSRMVSKISKDWMQSDRVDKFCEYLNHIDWSGADADTNTIVEEAYQNNSRNEVTFAALETAKACWAYLAFSEACFVCDNPCEFEKTIVFRDGYKISLGKYTDLNYNGGIVGIFKDELTRTLQASKYDLPPFDLSFFESVRA